MAQSSGEPTASLRLRRIVPARRERVYRAWTTPDSLRQWFAPPGMMTPVAEVDLRPGGRYRIGMQQVASGETRYLGGTFLEIDPPLKLVYSWAWESGPEKADETLVTVEFVERGERTEVILTHARFATEAERDMHNQGWNGCLDGLEAYLDTKA